jgi:alpha-L-arabinofuranosidase
MQREHGGGTVLDLGVESDEFETTVGGQQYRIGYLDICATLDEEQGMLYLSCVNFHRSEVMRLRVQGVRVGGGRFYSLMGASPDATNTLEQPNAVTVMTEDRTIGSDGIIELPPHSAHVIEMSLSPDS